MYGKFFSSTFTGSMIGAGPDVFAVWGYVIANTVGSQVELNPRLLAPLIGTTPERIAAAIDFLTQPDAESRSKTAEGRRLIKEGEYAYHVPNSEAYRAIKDENDRREYNRLAQQKSRAKKSAVKQRVNPSKRESAQAETETETKAVSVTGISQEIPDQPGRYTEDGRRLIRNPNGTGWMPVEE